MGTSMSKLTDCVGIICCSQPEQHANIRTLLYSLYLSDWKYSIEYGHVISGITWQAKDILTPIKTLVHEITHDKRLQVLSKRTPTGKTIYIRFRGEPFFPSLTEAEKEVLTYTSKVLASLPSEQQLKLIASTYPLIISDDEDRLDLPHLAAKYKQVSVDKYQYIV